MTPELWRRVESLLHAALAVAPAERADFLDSACGEDAAVRREVETLIRCDAKAERLIGGPLLLAPSASPGSRRPDASFETTLYDFLGRLRGLELGSSEGREEPRSALVPGTVLAQRYRIVRLLGRGGMGEVYLADDLMLGEAVALKLLPEPVAGDAAAVSRFLDEVRMARRITHPNVCRVYDVGRVDGRHFLSMEYIDGEDLDGWRKGRQPERGEILEVLRQVGHGLEAVHRGGILHCDLKPANLMIDGRGRARITDFGVAALAGGETATRARRGTPAYMAPEQHAGEPVSVQTDLYALGLVTYEALTGRPPFAGRSVTELARAQREGAPPPSRLGVELEPRVEEVVLRCLELDPRDRPDSAGAVVRALSGGGAAAGGEGCVPSAAYQLPPPPADFTGRETELAELRERIDRDGLGILGLQGMGGIGKTALALRLADELAPRFPDAQIYLDLRGASSRPASPSEAMIHVLRALRPEAPLPEGEAQLAAHYRSALHGRRTLLLLDNALDKEQVEPLIPPSSSLLLVTSRRAIVLPGLFAKSLESLAPEDATALLRRIVPRVAEEAETLARLCGHLPIALRLAGGTLAEHRDLSPSEYARRLAEGRGRLELIEASLDLSYEFLDAELQQLWRALAVFPGTFDPAAAVAIWDLEPNRGGFALSELVKHGLVDWAEGRYRLHDLTRLFAEHHLAPEERTEAERRHAGHYLEVLAELEEIYRLGSDVQGLKVLDTEWSNIQSGQAWAEAEARRDPLAARYCSDYPRLGSTILSLRLPTSQLIRWPEAGLEAARRRNDVAAQAHHLTYLGRALITSGDARGGGELCAQALALARRIGDLEGQRLSYLFVGVSHTRLGDWRRSVGLFEQSLSLARESGDRRGEGRVLSCLGSAWGCLGETRRGIALLDTALAIARELGDRVSETQTLNAIGYFCLDDPPRSIETLEEALRVARQIAYLEAEALAVGNLAAAHVELGKPRRAIELAEETLRLALAVESRFLECHGVGCVGRAALAGGETRRGRELLEQSLSLAAEIGDRWQVSDCSWWLGGHYEARGELERAADLMQVRVDYQRSIGHVEAEASAARVAAIRARARAASSPARGGPA